MQKLTTHESTDRRAFLKDLAVAGGAASLLGSGAALASGEAQPAAEKMPAASGYRETEHVRDYYRLARQ